MTNQEYAEAVLEAMNWHKNDAPIFHPAEDWSSAGVWITWLKQHKVSIVLDSEDTVRLCNDVTGEAYYEGTNANILLALKAASEQYLAMSDAPISLPPKSTSIIEGEITEIVRGKPSLLRED